MYELENGSSSGSTARCLAVVSIQSADGGATFGPLVPVSADTYFTGAIAADHRRGPAMVFYDLDDGPRGLWLVHERRRGLDDDVVVRRWRRGRFGPARAIPGSAGNVIGTAIAQDAKGRLAVAWYDSRGERIRVAASRKGRRWSRARTLGRSAGIPSTMSIGLGPDGRGLVVTDQGLVSRPLLVGRVDVRGLSRR